MHTRLILLGLLAAVVMLVGGGTIARAQTPVRHSLYQRYIDPFAASGWYPTRTDMGVDWFVTRRLLPRGPGDGVGARDGSLHEVSWGTGPEPSGSWIGRTVRRALLNA